MKKHPPNGVSAHWLIECVLETARRRIERELRCCQITVAGQAGQAETRLEMGGLIKSEGPAIGFIDRVIDLLLDGLNVITGILDIVVDAGRVPF